MSEFGGQTFSPSLLRRIWDFETRRGVNLAQKLRSGTRDPELDAIRKNYSDSSKVRAVLRATRRSSGPPAAARVLNARLRVLADARSRLTDALIERAAGEIDTPTFRIQFRKAFRANGVDVFESSGPSVASFLANRAIARALYRSYEISPPSRDEIVAQLASMLGDGVPKVLVRADVQRFYESIPHGPLLDSLRESRTFGTASYRLVRRLLDDFANTIGAQRGLPRGLALSAALSEVFLNVIDHEIRRDPDVLFYGRFVDDIVVVYSKSRGYKSGEKLAGLAETLESRGLTLSPNPSKRYEEAFGSGQPLRPMTYLGYEFEYDGSALFVRMSQKRVERLIRRLDQAFAVYSRSKAGGRSARLLFRRVEYLASNTRLTFNKRNAFVGVKFTNRHVTDLKQFRALDKRLLWRSMSIADHKLKSRVDAISFVDGFQRTRFHRYSTIEMAELTSIWSRNG